MPKKVSPEVKARAVRMVQEHREDYPSDTAAATVRRWVVQARLPAQVELLARSAPAPALLLLFGVTNFVDVAPVIVR